MSGDLGRAYLRQASADYACYELLLVERQPCSQWLHPLQASMEKTAKAYLAAGGASLEQLRQSHRAFRQLLGIVSRNHTIRTALGMISRQLRDHVAALRSVADDIERLVPGRDNHGPNVEYPWIDPRDEVHAPCEHAFTDVVAAVHGVQGRNLLKVFTRLLRDPVWQAALGLIDDA